MPLSRDLKSQLDNKALNCAVKVREMFGLRNEPIKDIYSLVSSKEFLLLRFPNKLKISGAFLEKKGRENNYKCIYINTNEPKGRQNFTLAHELYHAFFELSNDVVCMQSKITEDPIEYTAERFASHFLIPRQELVKCLIMERVNKNYPVSFKTLFRIQKYFQISFIALVFAIDDLRNIDKFSYYIPKNIGTFFKYKNEENWSLLEAKTKDFDIHNDLNSPNPIFEWPQGFRENIEKNLSNGVIEETDIQEINEFFS